MVQRVEGLSIDLDLNSTAIDRGLAGLKDKLKTVNSEMKSNMSAFDRADKSIEKYETSLKGLNKKLEVQQKIVSEARKEYDKMVKEYGKGSKEAEKAAREYNKQAAAFNNLDRYINKTTEELEQFRKEQQRANSVFSDFSDKLNTTSDSLSNYGQSMSAGLTVPLAGAGYFMGNIANQFEQSAGRIEAQLGVTAKRAEELNAIAEELWSDAFGQDVNEVANVISLIAQNMQDLSDADLKAVSEQAFILRDTFEYDFNESVRAARSLIENFGVEGTLAFDYITRAAQEGGDFAQDLLDTISEYSVQFADAGFSIEGMFNTLIQGANNGAFNLDKVGDAVKEFQIRATDGSETTADGFEAVGLQVDKMASKMAEGGDSAQDAFAVTVSALANVEDEVERNQAGVALFGTQWEDVREKVILALDPTEDMLGDVEGATEKAGKAIRENFGTRATRIWRDFQNELEPAGETLLDIGEEILPEIAESVEAVTDAFSDLSPETQENIVKIGMLATIAGPASLALGGITKGISVLTGAGQGLFSLLGKTRGAGLLGRIAGLGLGGPVGWGIAGLTALGGIIYSVTRDSKELNEVNFEVVQQMEKEVEATDNLISRFEQLQKANKLTKDETIEYMDVLSELEQTSSPDKIKELKERQEELLEKSGFTNKEMNEFLDLNDDIIKKAPVTAEAISKEGNAYADNLDALKSLNEEKRKQLTMEARSELVKALENERQLLVEKKQEIKEIKELEKEIDALYLQRPAINEKVRIEQVKLKELQMELNEIAREGAGIGSQKWVSKQNEVIEQKELLALVEAEKISIENTIADLEEKFTKSQKNLESVRKQLKETENLKFEYEQLILAQVNINAEKGKGIEKVNQEIERINALKHSLKQQLESGKLNTNEYNKQVGELDEQLTKLGSARDRLKLINQLAGSEVYADQNRQLDTQIGKLGNIKSYSKDINDLLKQDINKKVDIDTSPRISEINADLSSPLSRTLKVKRIWDNALENLYGANADGTSYFNHPSGMSWLGEEGAELVRHGNKWALADFGLYNLPFGTQVFTHDESKKILRSLNNIPAYATGISPSGEANRIATRLSEPSQPIVLELHVTSEIDGKVAGRALEKYVTEIQNRKQKVRDKFA